MGKVVSKKCCCASCWAAHRQCSRTSTSGHWSKCTRCASSRPHVTSNISSFIEAAKPFPHSVMQDQLYKNAPFGSTISLDAQGQDADSWNLQFSTSADRELTLSFENEGSFSAWNEVLVASLDGEIRRNFSADLKAKKGDSKLIAYAALAGGYAHCLCSTESSSEEVFSFMDGKPIDSNHAGYNVVGNFKCMIFSRLGYFVEEVMGGIRLINAVGMPAEFYSNAYAAAVILHHEIDYFQRSLRNGHLRSRMSTLLPASILTWLTSIGHELAQHIEEGCDRFLSWRSTIHGSMKKFRKQHRGETLSMSIKLRRDIFPTVMLDDQSNFIPPRAPSFTYDENWACLNLSADVALEATLSGTPEFYASVSRALVSHDSATSQPFMEILPEVPLSSPAIGTDESGQTSYHFSREADHELPLGTDASMTSMDPRYLVYNGWMTYQGPF